MLCFVKRGDFLARFCPLASGSSGNSAYIQSAGGAILVDAGISYKSIAERVALAGGSIDKIAAVAVTHSHDDHACGLKTLLKKTGVPLITTRKTAEGLAAKNFLPENAKFIFAEDGDTEIGGIELHAFSTSHDAPGSCGYKISTPSGSCAVCTDLGVVTDTVREAIAGCDVLLFEFNHDIDMLRRGPYPPHLKIRILSDLGHLSNNTAAAEIPFILNSGVKQIILGHLSRQNNTPDIALSAARIAAEAIGAKADRDFLLSVAKPGLSEVSVF